MSFKLGFTTNEAAKYAVENWHYSRKLPVANLVKIGVWEEGKFIGCLIYSTGANPNIQKPFSLKKNEVCELTRVALTTQKNPVSKFLAISLKMIKKKMPSLKLVVSYADPEQEHHGGIYQATNWIYLGETKKTTHYRDKNGFFIHNKTLSDGKAGSNYVKKLLEKGKITRCLTFKHKYIYPLSKELREEWKSKNKPYPKILRA